jgi:hypothetical protein
MELSNPAEKLSDPSEAHSPMPAMVAALKASIKP